MTMIESMALGLPVITTELGGAKDYIENGINGLFCLPKDSGTIVQAVKQLKDDGYRRQLATKAYATYRQNFTADKVVNQFESILRTALIDSKEKQLNESSTVPTQ